MSGEEPAPQIAPVEYPQMISTIKLPMLKKGEYTLWSIRMEQYLTNTDYGLWHVIMNGDELVQTTKDENGVKTEVPPKTAQALLQRQKERKAKSTLLLAILNEYQLRFHVVSNEDANQKFLRALPSSWNNIALIMRNKEGIDELDIDDLYNNLKVFKADIKGSSGSFSNSQNMAFLSTEDTNSINEVSTINGVSTAAGHSSQGQASSSLYTNDLMFSFFIDQSSGPQLDDEDLDQLDQDNLEEIDIKWQVDMLSMRVKYFYKKTKRKLIFNGKEPVGFDKAKDNALIVQDGLGYDWSYIAQDESTEFALMAYTSNSSGSDTEVKSCSKNCVKTYEKLQKQFDERVQTLSKANLEIVAYQLGLESIEAQLVVYQKNEVVYKENITVLEFEVKDKNKTGLGYGDQVNENSSDSGLFNSVFDSRSSDGDDNQINDRFKKDNEYHAVPPPLTGNYIPPLTDLSFAGLDDSIYWPTAN
ncbi:hypothetical protein Tco_0280299 [Tanacetum coccineum]